MNQTFKMLLNNLKGIKWKYDIDVTLFFFEGTVHDVHGFLRMILNILALQTLDCAAQADRNWRTYLSYPLPEIRNWYNLYYRNPVTLSDDD